MKILIEYTVKTIILEIKKDNMKIITWNCNGAFRKKFHLLDAYNADIIVIEECENPEESSESYKKWSANYLWVGEDKNKGIGIFVKNDNSIEALNWDNNQNNDTALKYFLACRINREYLLLGIWTQKAISQSDSYIGQLWQYLQLHRDKLLDEKVILTGDFNSNTIWDKLYKKNHSDVVAELEKMNISSLYHLLKNEEQGKEKTPTFYMQRNSEKPFHIDYSFLSSNLINNKTSLSIGNKDVWLKHSDHMPMIFSI